jgi:hypothetical protein
VASVFVALRMSALGCVGSYSWEAACFSSSLSSSASTRMPDDSGSGIEVGGGEEDEWAHFRSQVLRIQAVASRCAIQ